MNKRNGRTKSGSQQVSRRRITADTCPTCGDEMKPSKKAISLPVNGEDVLVNGVPHRSCPSCGESLLGLEEARLLARTAIETYRRRHHLLTQKEIRAIRDHFGLTQGAFARLLRLGPNTLSRWETGRNVQTAAMDLLLRLIRDRPENIKYLRAHAA
jgi:putative zinc finger/helix-turn-helix YgiT family protein